jgi:hypothetical protein
VVAVRQDNPELGEYWGAAIRCGSPLRNWSREWFTWRDESLQPLPKFRHLFEG